MKTDSANSNKRTGWSSQEHASPTRTSTRGTPFLTDDHHLAVTKLRLKLKKTKQEERPNRHDITGLQDSKLNRRYNVAVRNRFDALMEGTQEGEDDTNTSWNELQKVKAADNVLGFKRTSIDTSDITIGQEQKSTMTGAHRTQATRHRDSYHCSTTSGMAKESPTDGQKTTSSIFRRKGT